MSGLAILALGIWMKVELHVYMELTTVYYDAAPYILIAVGCVIIVFGSFGCLCTVKGFPALLYIVSLFHIGYLLTYFFLLPLPSLEGAP